MTTETLQMLLGYKRDLERVIRVNADQCNTAIAKRYLRGVKAALSRPFIEGPYGTRGEWGPNGAGPAIEDIVRQSEFHARYNAERERELA